LVRLQSAVAGDSTRRGGLLWVLQRYGISETAHLQWDWKYAIIEDCLDLGAMKRVNLTRQNELRRAVLLVRVGDGRVWLPYSKTSTSILIVLLPGSLGLSCSQFLNSIP
jgi:hypothetical protein